MDFRYAELCSFDPVEQIISKRFTLLDPFRITLIKDQRVIKIDALEDIEWISIGEFKDPSVDYIVDPSVDLPCIIKAGNSKLFYLTSSPVHKLNGSFRILKDQAGQIFTHQWTLE